jgi:hypothetical protein
MDERLQQAVNNNARWCDLVCAAQGIPTTWAAGLWAARRRPPRFYPDAVTLSRGVSADIVLADVVPGPGASVKDSFADLALAERGFERLFDAVWIAREAPAARPPNTALAWSPVTTAHELAEWLDACGLTGILPAKLGLEPAARFLAGRDSGELCAGAIAHRTGSVVGVSNVFGDVWPDIPAAVSLVFPGAPLVGYEHGHALAAALSAGFHELGPLRVWAAAG